MVKIAIVEDEKSAADELSRFLGEYYEEKGGDYRVDVYGDALSFLAAYDGYDVVFMDIELPDYDGMRAAKKLRDTDDTVIIVFVTNMRSFAVEGYKVGALDFVMKPVGRPVLRSLLRKVDRILLRTRGSKVTVKTWGGGIKLLDADEIYYVEVARHHLVFHTEGGELERASHHRDGRGHGSGVRVAGHIGHVRTFGQHPPLALRRQIVGVLL